MEADVTMAKPAAKPPLFVKDMTLSEAYNRMTERGIFAPNTPLAIRILENPASPLALPGSIDLKKHDYLHCLLNQPMTVKGEAYVLGFTMGADPKTKPWHVWVFKMAARYVYPKKYRFKDSHMDVFDHALALGRKSRVLDFQKFDFSGYTQQKLEDLRHLLIGVDEVVAQS